MTILWPTAYNTTRTLHDVVINSEASHWSPSAHVFHVIYKTHHITRIRNWSIPKGLTSSSGLLTAPCTVECPLSKSMAAFSETRSVHLAVWNVLIHREGCLSAYNHRNTFQHCIKIKNPPPSPFTLLPKPLIFLHCSTEIQRSTNYLFSNLWRSLNMALRQPVKVYQIHWISLLTHTDHLLHDKMPYTTFSLPSHQER